MVETVTEQSPPEPGAYPTRDEDLLVVWKRLHKVMCGWRGQLWRNLFSNKQAWINFRRQTSEPMSAFLKYAHWQELRRICAPLSDTDIDYLRVLAQQKFEYAASQFRFNVVMFITVPVTAAVVTNQLSPDLFTRFVDFWVGQDDGDDHAAKLRVIGLAIVLTMTTIAILFNSVYKSRELRMALEIEAGRRRLLRGETIASAGGDTTDISL